MAEYIEREAVLEMSHGGVILKDRVSALPAADVAPVVHGRWEFKHPNGWACSKYGEWGLMIDNRGICKSNYCPNCGAKMDAKKSPPHSEAGVPEKRYGSS